MFGYLLVGLGSGSTFLSSLGASFQILPEKPGLAVSLPGICMSLSMAFTIMLENREWEIQSKKKKEKRRKNFNDEHSQNIRKSQDVLIAGEIVYV